MTMRLTVVNNGPESYQCQINREGDPLPLAVLKMGESADVYCWEGAQLVVTEINGRPATK